MSDRQLKLAAPVGVGGPGQQNTGLSSVIPGDASVNIGLLGTITTRGKASPDMIGRRRAGWNLVSNGESDTVGNSRREEHLDSATRYRGALEHVTVARGRGDGDEGRAGPRKKIPLATPARSRSRPA
jgi:hypothetical protein